MISRFPHAFPNNPPSPSDSVPTVVSESDEYHDHRSHSFTVSPDSPNTMLADVMRGHGPRQLMAGSVTHVGSDQTQNVGSIQTSIQIAHDGSGQAPRILHRGALFPCEGRSANRSASG